MSAPTAVTGAAKRTLSALLKSLPENGIGSIVARDTWHPESGKQWEVTSVRPKKNSSEHLEAYGYLYYHGARTHTKVKRIASVWKYGWYLKDESSTPSSSSSSPPVSQPDPSSHLLASQPIRRGLPQDLHKCLICQESGHGSSQCPQRLSNKCHVCESVGHWSNDCPQRFKKWRVWLNGLTGQQRLQASAPPP